jgi:hypothetical protein
MTTWIVETSEKTWASAGMDKATEEEAKAYCEEVFRDDLDGHPLITNRSVWRTFPVVRNERLYYKNIVLLGDAVRSACSAMPCAPRISVSAPEQSSRWKMQSRWQNISRRLAIT